MSRYGILYIIIFGLMILDMVINFIVGTSVLTSLGKNSGLYFMSITLLPVLLIENYFPNGSIARWLKK